MAGYRDEEMVQKLLCGKKRAAEMNGVLFSPGSRVWRQIGRDFERRTRMSGEGCFMLWDGGHWHNVVG